MVSRKLKSLKPKKLSWRTCFNMIEIKLGDAFKLIKEIPDNSIDLILADPPYDRNRYMKPLRDIEKKYMAEQFKRVLKPTGNIVLFCGFYCKWKWFALLSKVGLKFQQELIWIYENPGMIRWKIKHFTPAHDNILWFSKTESYYFNNEGTSDLTWFKHKVYCGVLRGKENLPKDITITPKPLKISDILVKRLCPKGGIILDPFMGTGTFGISAQRYGCNYIGFEIKPEIFEIAKKRLRNLTSFGGKR